MSIESDIIDEMTDRMDNPEPDTREYHQCDTCPSHSENGNHPWHYAFKQGQPDSPNHIMRDGETLCGTDMGSLGVPTALFEGTRETLLHPETSMQTPERFCETCLTAFRERYEFALTESDLECPECGSQSQAVVHPRDGATSCKGCGWNR